jgi:triosephosphate isomerase
MRPTIIAGNWKMNLTREEAILLAEGLKKSVNPSQEKKVWVFPSTIHVSEVRGILKDSSIQVGLQNIYPSEPTAMTGEVCPSQTKGLGIQMALVGHSERRQFLGETNSFCQKKILFLLENSWTAVYCIGENLEERESGRIEEILGTQLTEGLRGIDPGLVKNLVLAYEPVWAIGTGKTATPEMAQSAHLFIRNKLAEIFSKDLAESIPILYGGSVKPDNIQTLLAEKDIDGGLVGGASQKLDSFLGLLA